MIGSNYQKTLMFIGLMILYPCLSNASKYTIMFDKLYATRYHNKSLTVRQGCRLGGGNWTHNDGNRTAKINGLGKYTLETSRCKKDSGQFNKRRHVKYVEIKYGNDTCKININSNSASVDKTIHVSTQCGSIYIVEFNENLAEIYRKEPLEVRQGCRLNKGTWTHNNGNRTAIIDGAGIYTFTTSRCKKDPLQSNKRRDVKYVEVKYGNDTCKVAINTSGSSFTKTIKLNTQSCEKFRALDRAEYTPLIAKYSPAFDYDSDSCLPASAFSRRNGEQNGGLKPTGSITGKCRNNNYLNFSNTYHRSIKNGEYEAHMYELYFEKDQCIDTPLTIPECGHRHDIETVIIYFKNDKPEYIAVSAHGDYSRRKWQDIETNGEHPKIVYHKEGLLTHALRFAKKDEQVENPRGGWTAPRIISWASMKGDEINNKGLRQKLNDYSYDKASFKFIDENFLSAVNKSDALPDGYSEFK